jgi:hypothetical protein
MDKDRQFVYFIEVKENDGKKTRYPVYRQGEDYYIADHLLRQGKSMEDEVKEIFGAEMIGPVQDIPLHQDTKFKKED